MLDLATGFLDFARNNKEMYRTHDCNSLRKSDIGKQVVLAGWVNVTRDHGGVIFIDLRDREGLTQVVFRPEENAQLAKQAHTLRGEDVIQVSGQVAARPAGTENRNLATGEIEIIPSELKILNRADDLPFPIDAEPHNEDLRMTHRYFDLRRARFSQKRPAIFSTARGLSKWKLQFFPRARRRGRAIF
jgi:aspartyl-tRNA synthetase